MQNSSAVTILLLALPQNHPATSLAVPAKGRPFPCLDLKHVENETPYVPRTRDPSRQVEWKVFRRRSAALPQL